MRGSGCCGLGKPTITGPHGNGEDAPKPVLPAIGGSKWQKAEQAPEKMGRPIIQVGSAHGPIRNAPRAWLARRRQSI